MKKPKINITGLIPFIPILIFFPFRGIYPALAAVFFHELSHCAAVFLCGKKTERIDIGIGGLKIKTEDACLPLFCRLFILLSGCFMNIVCFAVCRLWGIFDGFAFASLAFALFNILPVKTLDGGEALFCVLDVYLMPAAAYGISRCISFLFLTALWAICSFNMLFGYFNVSLFICICVLFVRNAFDED